MVIGRIAVGLGEIKSYPTTGSVKLGENIRAEYKTITIHKLLIHREARSNPDDFFIQVEDGK